MNTNLFLMALEGGHYTMAEGHSRLSKDGGCPASELPCCLGILATQIPDNDNCSQEKEARNNRRDIPQD